MNEQIPTPKTDALLLIPEVFEAFNNPHEQQVTLPTPMHLTIGLCRQLERERAMRRSGPIAENLLRDVGTVASKVS